MSEPEHPTRATRRPLLIGAVAAVAAAAGAGLAWRQQAAGHADSGHGTAAAGQGGAAAGGSPELQALWPLRFDRPEGGELAMASLRGKPLVINFWATWCAPCVRELPELDRFHRDFAGRGWQVLGLAIDGPTPVREFLGRVKLGFPIGLAGLDGTELVRALGNTHGGLPFSVLVDAAGRIAQRKLGETSYAELSGWAARL
ncbi:TlpA disulfide reductase family protein [Aquabacterium sp. OR-4]|uniref:TlpA disulfide reductase family protein n=1 Tax=Aquabacterium sp. OR-4 TaxID=2978127 RepID=UPI0021B33E39|nr:TlpA disulfide reductase family protein [Aquabacterium sp. OR-4]MDT7834394.1 TlpA disulfide reductase family protein [Aquabacterium sp. OR-4]